MKYKLDELFKDRHDTMYLITKLPEFVIRKDKKLTYTDERYHLTRIPDILEYKSRYDNTTVRFTLPVVTMIEEMIDLNVRRKNWIKI